jgi:lysozyme
MALRGIDVSNHQGVINWSTVVQDNVHFAFFKATESNNYRDTFFDRNLENTRHFGLPRGFYHFARPNANDAKTEAYFFLNSIKYEELQPGEMLVLDMEDEKFGSNPAPWTLNWLEIVESIVGFKPLLYTGSWYLSKFKFDATTQKLKNYPLWLANYRATKPPTPAPWTGYEFWQYSDNGRVQGISGPCDLNEFSGTIQDLPAYGKPQTAPPQPQIDIEAIKDQLDALESNNSKMRALLQSNEAVARVVRKIITPE